MLVIQHTPWSPTYGTQLDGLVICYSMCLVRVVCSMVVCSCYNRSVYERIHQKLSYTVTMEYRARYTERVENFIPFRNVCCIIIVLFTYIQNKGRTTVRDTVYSVFVLCVGHTNTNQPPRPTHHQQPSPPPPPPTVLLAKFFYARVVKSLKMDL